jgi:hypothetical protein
MAVLITGPLLEQILLEQRKARDADHSDEVWEGLDMTAPLPHTERQEIGGAAGCGARQAGGVARTRTGPPWNELLGPGRGLEPGLPRARRCASLTRKPGEHLDTHWRGAIDFLIEIVIPGDRTREKISFFERLGARELLLVDRSPWRLEMQRHAGERLAEAGQSSLPSRESIASPVRPLEFRLVAGKPCPRIAVRRTDAERVWLV